MAGMEQQVGELLRRFREQRGISVRTLAASAGFSASFISQVENGQASPSIASLEKIATCLDLSLSEFFFVGEFRTAPVVRAGERNRIESGWSNAAIESLGVDRMSRLQPLLITLRGGGTSGKHPHAQGREQFAFVVSGELTLELDESEHSLRSGDAVTIPAQTPFRWVNSSSEPAQLLVISSRGL